MLETHCDVTLQMGGLVKENEGAEGGMVSDEAMCEICVSFGFREHGYKCSLPF